MVASAISRILTQIPASGARVQLGTSGDAADDCRNAFFSLTVCSGAFAGEAQGPGSDSNPWPVKPSPAARTRHARTGKPRSLPLSSASAYASEHAASLPVSSPPRPAAAPSHSWTGFYVGAGAGAAAAQP